MIIHVQLKMSYTPIVVFEDENVLSDYTEIFEMDHGTDGYTPFANIRVPPFCTLKHVYNLVVEEFGKCKCGDRFIETIPPTFCNDGKIAYIKIWNRVTNEYNVVSVMMTKDLVEVFVGTDLGIGFVENVFAGRIFPRIKKYNNFFANLHNSSGTSTTG